ncbi:hypothetical protein M3I54_28130 [Paraburkholderia sp. CNPSo 3274]|uniref:hypothetical protein n=1 Tax=Paraburkholderia sp. CNPSo 3274 TaxID=2940932 RepID=UPI0020B7098E|nr:hypothetical protein [Paraburkholderia sp. CNPSo 3274]MCP3710797.1 hypothetical protein [Paraburkholderia sp. CNPSo 3274]
MAVEYRGFRVTVDAKADATDTQWLCRAVLEGVDAQVETAKLPSVELAIPKLKIDVLMALSVVEQTAKQAVDEWWQAKQPEMA